VTAQPVVISTPNGPVDAELMVPDGPGPWPGVVVVHDLRGPQPEIRDSMARFAGRGFLSIAPDLYTRGGTARCVTRTLASMLTRKGAAVEDLTAARDLLAARTDCTGKIGIVGFCMGGGFALVMGTKGFDASAPFYPTLPPVYESIARDTCPVVASFGSRDVWNPGSGPRLRRALDRHGVVNDVMVYPGVGHAFANDLPNQPLQRIIGFGRDVAATEDAYSRVLTFFDKTLTQ
jgi:carboxymethylenebutenolidase